MPMRRRPYRTAYELERALAIKRAARERVARLLVCGAVPLVLIWMFLNSAGGV